MRFKANLNLIIILIVAALFCSCNFVLTEDSNNFFKNYSENTPERKSQWDFDECDKSTNIQQPEESYNDSNSFPPKLYNKKSRLLISAVGDIMVHKPQLDAAKQSDGVFDFKEVFREIKPYIEKADIALANFETTIGTPERGYSGYPRFSSPHELLKALQWTGFDVLITANNHCLDWLEFGLENTLNKIDENGLLHTGTARSFEESQRFLVIEKNNIKVGILAYTYGTNGMEAFIPSQKLKYMVNYFNDFEKVRQDIKDIKAAGAELVIMYMHWGNEYERIPSKKQKDLAHQLAINGADIIFGSHPHVIQPIEIKNVLTQDGTQKKVFVAYSLGNFISNQRERYTDSGVIANVEIVKDYESNTIFISKIEYIPTWVYKYYQNGKIQYRILPVEKYMNNEGEELKEMDQQRIQAVWHETTSLLGNAEIDIQ